MLETDVWDSVADTIKQDDFYKPSHQKIFNVIFDLNTRRQPVDILTVTSTLRDKGDSSGMIRNRVRGQPGEGNLPDVGGI